MMLPKLFQALALFILFVSCSSQKTVIEKTKPDLTKFSFENRQAEIVKINNGIENLIKADSEWKSIFNGKDLTGWQVKCKPEDKGKSFWFVKDGAIEANSIGSKTHDYVWLTTDKDYRDFILKLKFQAYEDANGNSGVQFRSRYDDADMWLDGPQVDVAPKTPWRTGMVYDETRETRRWIAPNIPRGSWVDTTMANPNLIFKFGENNWNDLEIRAIGTKFSVKLNGVVVNSANLDGILDDKDHSKHDVGMNGKIALQIHSKNQVKIMFKDILVLTL